jgi:DNA repair protein RadC
MIFQNIVDTERKDDVFFTSPKMIFDLVEDYKDAPQEYFFVITLRGVRVIGVYISTIGIANRTFVHPREIFYRAILDHATNIIIVHNHPSGEPNPSDDDLTITKELHEIGIFLRIKIMDHIIISKNNYYSFLENKNILGNNKIDYKQGVIVSDEEEN